MRFIEGTDNFDYLTTSSEDTIYYTKKGNDRIKDYWGDDTYLFNIGDGSDIITDTNGYDIIKFGIGITLNDIIFSRKNNNIIININNTDDQITIIDWYSKNRYKIEKVEFSDGNFLTWQEIENSTAAQSLLASTITGTEGNDVLRGTNNPDTIYGKAGNDTIYASNGNDIIYGESGNDVIDDGEGDDTVYGGAGNDTYYVDNLNDVMVEYANEGIDIAYSSISYTLGDNFENLTLTGSGNNATGNELNNVIRGNSGNNTLYGLGGNDTIYASGGNDVIYGGSGNDIIDDGGGDDTVYGGPGNDTYYIDNLNDVMIESANEGIDIAYSSISYTLNDNFENLTLTGTRNNDGTGNEIDNIITGNLGNNILNGGAGNDIIYASWGSDAIYGGDGNDEIDDGAGDDTVYGGSGNDTYYIDNLNDVMIEYINEGIDIAYSSISYTLNDNFENLTLTGSSNNNGTGNELDNIITGNSGYNVLNGGDGNDTIDGGVGRDTLIGGNGDDIYYVDNPDDLIIESSPATPPDTSWITSEYLKDIYARTFPRVMGNQWHVCPDGLFYASTRYTTVNGITQVDWEATQQANDILSDLATTYLDYLGLNRAGSRQGTSDYNDLFLDNYDSVKNPNTGLNATMGYIKAEASAKNRTIYVLPYLNMTDVWYYESSSIHPEWYFWHSNELFDGQNFGTWDYCNENSLFLTKNGEILHYYTGNDTNRPLFDSTNPMWQAYYVDHCKGICEAGFDGVFSDNWWRSKLGDTVLLTNEEFAALQEGWNTIAGLVKDVINDKMVIGNSPPYYKFTNRDIFMLEDRIDDILGTNDKSIASYFRYSDQARDAHQVCQDTYWDEDRGPFETFRLPMNLLTDNILGVTTVTDIGTGIESYFIPAEILGEIGYPLGDREILPGTDTGIKDVVSGYSFSRAVYARYYSYGAVYLNNSGSQQTITLPPGEWLRSDGVEFSGGDSVTVDNCRGWVFKKTDEIPMTKNEGIDSVYSTVSYTLGSNVENLNLTGTNDINAAGNELDNIITGNTGNNTLTGNTGNDTIYGNDGNDIYIFNLNDGQDTITDTNGIDTIKLGEGISIDDLTFSQIDNNIIIELKDPKNRITVIDWYSQPEYQIEKIEFQDGTYLTNTDINSIIQQLSTFTIDDIQPVTSDTNDTNQYIYQLFSNSGN